MKINRSALVAIGLNLSLIPFLILPVVFNQFTVVVLMEKLAQASGITFAAMWVMQLLMVRMGKDLLKAGALLGLSFGSLFLMSSDMTKPDGSRPTLALVVVAVAGLLAVSSLFPLYMRTNWRGWFLKYRPMSVFRFSGLIMTAVGGFLLSEPGVVTPSQYLILASYVFLILGLETLSVYVVVKDEVQENA